MHHLTYRSARYFTPRFNGAIIQSPTFLPRPSDANSDATYTSILQKAGAANLDELAEKSSVDLIGINTDLVFNSAWGQYTFGPLFGSDETPEAPSKLLKDGKNFKNIPILLGYTALDGLSLTPPWVRSNAELQDFFKTIYKDVSSEVLDKVGSAYPVTSPNGGPQNERKCIMQASDLLRVSEVYVQWHTVLI